MDNYLATEKPYKQKLIIKRSQCNDIERLHTRTQSLGKVDSNPVGGTVVSKRFQSKVSMPVPNQSQNMNLIGKNVVKRIFQWKIY